MRTAILPLKESPECQFERLYGFYEGSMPRFNGTACTVDLLFTRLAPTLGGATGLQGGRFADEGDERWEASSQGVSVI
ncbi:MAG: hypothetical protein C4293_08040 [Nitrospiraceae bacterium]